MSASAGWFEVLRAAERSPVPWKNGGGVTREVAVHPPGSGLAAFDWRVSIAEVRRPGPFSLFAGVDRRMAILTGRLSLTIEGRAALTLAPESEACAFPGDVPAAAAPLAGPVTDLNVMTRRARCAARLTRCSAPRFEPQADTTILIALADLTLDVGGAALALTALDALRIARVPGGACAVDGNSTPYYLVEISDHPPT